MICRRIAGILTGYLPLGIHWTGAPQAEAPAVLRRALAAHGPIILVAPGPEGGPTSPAARRSRQMAVLDLLSDARYSARGSTRSGAIGSVTPNAAAFAARL